MQAINTFDQLKKAVEDRLITAKQAIAISYHPPEARSVKANGCKIWSPFFKTDKDAHFLDYGAKYIAGNKKESLPLAIKWAIEQYGELNFVRNRMGDYVPKIVNDKFPLAN